MSIAGAGVGLAASVSVGESVGIAVGMSIAGAGVGEPVTNGVGAGVSRLVGVSVGVGDCGVAPGGAANV